jgi:pimeloyl-ACP methyl ester carboxylesterase
MTVAVEGDGSPLLYLHGLLAQGSIARSEAPSGFRLATYDQRGHASGTPFVDPSAYALEEFVADALEVLHALGWERAALGGTSMGAVIALRLALDHPDLVETLILTAPPFADVKSQAVDTFDEMAAELEELEPAEAIRTRRAAALERGMPLEATSFFDTWAAHDPHAIAVALRTVPRWIPFPDLAEVSRLEMPIVVLAWPEDPLHPLDVPERIAALTGAPLGLLSGIAEVLAHPDAVSRELTALLASRR